jgi:hypothetical protein
MNKRLTEAKKAADGILGNTSAPLSSILDDLRDLRDHVEMLIDAVSTDISNEETI